MYDLLGVARDATSQEIVSAFRDRARTAHPDKGGDAAEFVRLKHARDTLCDNDRRAAYDATLNGQQELPRSPDQHVTMQIPLQEAVRGASRSMKANSRVPCGVCKGDGMRADLTTEERARALVVCDNCHGARMTPMGPCHRCGMTGRVLQSSHVCRTCGGTRKVHNHATIPFEIPRGCADGQVIRLRGTSSAQHGHAPGDIVITVRVQPSDGFDIVHAHLIRNVDIPLIDALVGGEIVIRHPDGDARRLQFDGGVQHGSMIVYPGHGVHTLASLALRAHITIPRLEKDARAQLLPILPTTTTRAHPATYTAIDRHTIMTEQQFAERVREEQQQQQHDDSDARRPTGQQVQCAQS